MNENAVPRGRKLSEREDPCWLERFARRPIALANLVSLAVAQLGYSDTIPLTRIGATSVGKLFDALSTPLLLTDRSLRIAFANRACAKLDLGYGKNLGCSLDRIFETDSTAKGFRFLMKSVFANRIPLMVQATVRVGGAWRPVRLHVRNLKLGRKRSILIIIEDFTSQASRSRDTTQPDDSALRAPRAFKELDEMLFANVAARETWELALQMRDCNVGHCHDAAPSDPQFCRTDQSVTGNAVVISDMRGRALYLNASFTRVLGWAVPELLDQEMPCLKESQDGLAVFQMLEWITNGSTSEQFPLPGYADESSPGPVGLRVPPSVARARGTEGLPAILRSSVEHEPGHVAWHNEETARALLHASSDAVVLLDTQGFVLASNLIFAKRVGLTVEQFVGRNLLEFFPKPLLHARMARGIEAIETGRTVRFSDENAGRYQENTVCPLFDRHGRVERLAVVCRDVTDQVRMRAELQIAREAAQAANRAKSEFLANVSHELRTPLNAIIGFSEILEDKLFGELNEKQLAHVSHVLSSGRQLLELIDNVLDLASVESGQMELRIAGVDISQVLQSSMVMIKERAWKQGLRTYLRVADEVADMRIEADQAKLKQIVFTLLSNAVKFTPLGGQIVVEADKAADNVIIRVTDSGIGLRPEDQDRVFHVFEQVDSSPARKHAGTGLGLALTRRMVELHGGTIWVSSPGEGCGSTFAFSIPVCSPVRTVSQISCTRAH